MRRDPTDGESNSKNWDEFGNGITARRKRVVDAPEIEPHQPPYSDAWADKAFNKPGPNIDVIIDTTHK